MKYFVLTKEEKQILDDYESGKLKSVPDFKKQKQYYEEIARNTLNKSRNINIRLTEKTLSKLKAKAIEEGIPYQTLASSVLHKYVMKSTT